MRPKRLSHFLMFLLAGMLVAAVGCEPVIVYVTPTPDLTLQAQATTNAQVAALPSETVPPVTIEQTPTNTSTETPATTPEATETALPPAATLPPETPAQTFVVPQVTPLVPDVTPGPTSIVQGPIVGPEYVLPASPVPPTQQGVPTTAGASPTPIVPTGTGTVVPANLPTLDGNQIGVQLDVNLDDADWDFAMAMLEQLGVTWVKVQIPWRDMQPNGPDERDNPFFRRVEQHIEDANRRGFNVLVSIVKAPGWARRTDQAEDGTPDDPQALANFITLMYDEINAGDRPEDFAIYGHYLDAVEIWNEPNLIREWRGSIPFSGAGYMRLFAPAYQAVRAVASDVPVITAGLAPTTNTEFSRDDREFLREMYNSGLAGYNDPNLYVGIHPYGWGNAPDATCCDPVEGRNWDEHPSFFFSDTLRQYREIMTSSGDADRRMWTTEFGWASWDGFPGAPPEEWMSYTDRWAQGGYTIRAFQIGQQSGYMGPMILWNLNFAVLSGLIENRDERAAYSMLLPGGQCNIEVGSSERTERPLYWMLYDAIDPNQNLGDFCGVPPLPLPGLP